MGVALLKNKTQKSGNRSFHASLHQAPSHSVMRPGAQSAAAPRMDRALRGTGNQDAIQFL